MKAVEDKITQLMKQLDDLEPGSEEYERVANAIAALVKANADDKKADNDGKNKNVEKWTGIATALAAVGGVIVAATKEILKRRTNKDVMRYEEDDVITSKAFDNR